MLLVRGDTQKLSSEQSPQSGQAKSGGAMATLVGPNGALGGQGLAESHVDVDATMNAFSQWLSDACFPILFERV